MSPKRRAIILAPKDNLDLLGSYGRALADLGWDITWWSLHEALDRNVRFGRAGRLLASFVAVEPWVNKANRELIVLTRELAPDLVLAAGVTPLRAGALAQIRVSSPRTKTALLWPDPLQNLGPTVAQSLAAFDLIGNYSRVANPELTRLGARHVVWLPFAADPWIFPPDVVPTEADRARYGCDVIFIGNYRPEREGAMNALHRAGLQIRVFGERTWLRFARDRARVQQYFEGRPLFGADMVRAMKSSRVCLNVIDDTNYPAANMRSFEGPACGGAMLQTRAPELEPLMTEGRATLYFDNEADMIAKAKQLVADATLRDSIAAEGQRVALNEHTYVHRARTMLDALGLADDDVSAGESRARAPRP